MDRLDYAITEIAHVTKRIEQKYQELEGKWEQVSARKEEVQAWEDIMASNAAKYRDQINLNVGNYHLSPSSNALSHIDIFPIIQEDSGLQPLKILSCDTKDLISKQCLPVCIRRETILESVSLPQHPRYSE